MRALTAVLTLLLASSCFLSRDSLNAPIPRERLAALVPGQTTAQEVVDLLGAPVQVVELHERSAYQFLHTRGKRAGFSVILFTMINEDRRSDRVWVFFDANDVLTHVGTTIEADTASYAMPYQDLEDGDSGRDEE